MTRVATLRTTTAHEGFRALVAELDAELRDRYGAIQDQFAPFNKVDDIPIAVLVSDTTGWVACGCLRQHDATTAELKRMYVRADRRRRGFANVVLDELERWARELGIATILLETGDRQPEAVALYARRGWTVCDPFGPYVGMSNSQCMVKTL